MTNAYWRGWRYGVLFAKPSGNPYAPGHPFERDFDEGWRAGAAQTLAERDAERSQRAGRMSAESCTELGT